MLCLPSSIITSSRGGRPKLQPPALSVSCTSLTANQIAHAIVNWKFNFCKGFSSESRPIVQILLHNWQSFPVEYVGSGHCTCHNTCHRRKRGVSQVTIRLLRKTHHNTVHSVQLGAKKSWELESIALESFQATSQTWFCAPLTEYLVLSWSLRVIRPVQYVYKAESVLVHWGTPYPAQVKWGALRCTEVHWGTSSSDAVRYIQLRISEVYPAEVHWGYFRLNGVISGAPRYFQVHLSTHWCTEVHPLVHWGTLRYTGPLSGELTYTQQLRCTEWKKRFSRQFATRHCTAL